MDIKGLKKIITAALTGAIIFSQALPAAAYENLYNTEPAGISADSYYEGYSKIIDEYKGAYEEILKGNKNIYGQYPQVNYMFIMYNNGKALYALKDLDSDGTPELFIGEKTEGSRSYTLFGMFAFKNGSVINMHTDIGERNRLFVLDTNELYMSGSSGAAYSSFEICSYNNGEFTVKDYYDWADDVTTYNGSSITKEEWQTARENTESRIADLDWKSADSFADEKPSEHITVLFNGTELSFGVEPYIENGVTMVPMRAIFEALGAEVSYDFETKTITAVKGERNVVLTAGSLTAYINGESTALQCAPVIISGSAMVPLRFVSESLDASVEWNGSTRTVYITS